MKKLILTLAFATMDFIAGYAAKAYPGAITITQNDGTQVDILLHGDEHLSWYTTTDGILLVQVGGNYYVAQVEDDGSLKATPQLAHNASQRSNIENQVIALQNKQSFFNATQVKAQAIRKNINIDSSNPYFPHVGSPKALVILAQFQDCQFKTSKPTEVFNYLLNAEAETDIPEALATDYNPKYSNHGSVRQYFSDMSEGVFTPQFDVKGVVTLSKNYAYYGEDNTYNKDIHYTDLVKEACELAKSELGVNFSEYDADNDGKVDLVYIIHAGYGQNNGGDSNTLWAKTSFNYATTIDNEIITVHGINSELNSSSGNYITGIGVLCHEFSHTMGIPDLYPYNTNAYVNNQEPEYWDLMDAGEYANNGYTPVPYCAWEMEAMGWNAGIEELGKVPQQISMKPHLAYRQAYKIEADNGEYLLLQNVQRTGWGQGYLSHGLLIYRIDYDKPTIGLNYRMNQTPNQPEVTILPADGIIISGYLSGDGLTYTKTQYNQSHWGDPFPGYNKVTQLLEAKLNNTTLTNLLYNIKEADGVITFDYLEDITNGISHPTLGQDANLDGRIFTLDGRYLGTDASHLSKGIYIIGKKKVIVK